MMDALYSTQAPTSISAALLASNLVLVVLCKLTVFYTISECELRAFEREALVSFPSSHRSCTYAARIWANLSSTVEAVLYISFLALNCTCATHGIGLGLWDKVLRTPFLRHNFRYSCEYFTRRHHVLMDFRLSGTLRLFIQGSNALININIMVPRGTIHRGACSGVATRCYRYLITSPRYLITSRIGIKRWHRYRLFIFLSPSDTLIFAACIGLFFFPPPLLSSLADYLSTIQIIIWLQMLLT